LKIFNPRGLPECVVAAAGGFSDYVPSPGRFGVLDLIGPPLIRKLRIEHWDDILVEVEDLTAMLLGSGFHLLMEKHSRDAIAEEKVELPYGEFVIAGKVDLRTKEVIQDFKVTSVWSFVFGDKPEWEAQLNVYRYMLWKKYGEVPDKLQVIAIFKDWVRSKSESASDYPAAPMMGLNIPVWSLEDAEKYIDDRMNTHLTIKECTPFERWTRPTTYAVKKRGRKSALRVLNSLEEAQAWLEKNGGDSIETRIGEDVRCKWYCPVRDFCPYKKEKDNATEEDDVHDTA